ncbi:NUMOD4 motif-containing HNH endonuclease [Larkinella ripae]
MTDANYSVWLEKPCPTYQTVGETPQPSENRDERQQMPVERPVRSPTINPILENWRTVSGYEGLYEVSDLGNIRRMLRSGGSRQLKPLLSSHHKPAIELYRPGVPCKKRSLSLLVADAFVQNPEGATVVRHFDGNPYNNAANNLFWVLPMKVQRCGIGRKDKLAAIDLPGEEWRAMVGYEGRYEVSNLGRIKSVPFVHPRTGNTLRGNLLRVSTNKDGYSYFRALGSKNIRVHRAVAMAFLPNPNALPEVNHIDGNKQNARLSNLEWITREDNIQHALRTGLIDLDHVKRLPSYRKARRS